jgi:hypothetical protein
VVALRRQARNEAAAGRFAAAEQALPAGPYLAPPIRMQDVAWIALHPDVRSPERQRDAYAGLATTRPTAGSGLSAARLYLLGRLALELGSSNELEAARHALREFRPLTPDLGRFAQDLDIELESATARRQGNVDLALETLLRASYWERRPVWLGFPAGSFLTTRLADRTSAFMRAELLRETGNESEAALWYRVAADGIWYRAPALRALAGILQAEGRTEEADSLRRRAAALWVDADPDGSRE